MVPTLSQRLTNYFYAWEQRGRGWYYADHLVHIEPPFVPFSRYDVYPRNIIDDGKLPRATDQTLVSDYPHFKQAHKFDDDIPLNVYCLTIAKHFKQSADRMERLLITLSVIQRPLSFEIIASADTISLQWVCRESDGDFLCAQVQMYFPDCSIREIDGDLLFDVLKTELPLYTVDFGLREEFMRPLQGAASLDHDPLTSLFAVISRLTEEQYIIVQILFCGTPTAWAGNVLTSVTDESGRASFFVDAPEMPDLAKDKISRPLFAATIRVLTMAEELDTAGILLERVATTLMQASQSANNSLIPLSDESYTVEQRFTDILLRVSHRVGMLLNSRELLSFVHVPSSSIHTHKLIPTRTTKQAPLQLMGQPYILGINEHEGMSVEVGLPIDTRLRHTHIIGVSGSGKSTLLHTLIMNDVQAKHGIMVLDPHGDLIDTVLASIPKERVTDVVLIDPSDGEFPISFNILSAHSDIERELVASDLVALFRRFSTSWGDQMNSVFANAIMATLYNSRTFHIGDLRRFLIEPGFRTEVLATVTDTEIAYYWQKEYALLRSTSLGPILTRLDTFLRPKSIRNMICQTKGLDLAQLMDSKKIILVKLAQGLMGAENSYLLGAFLVSKLQQIVMSRQALTTEERIPFFCYIDEFQHFITPSMNSIFTGARKYAVGMVVAHQDLTTLLKADAETAHVVLANAGTRICFRPGDADAKVLAEGFTSFNNEDLQQLAIGEAIVRANTANNDFNLSVVPYEQDMEDYTASIVEHSRATYAKQIVQPEEPVSIVKQAMVSEAPEIIVKPFAPSQNKEAVREHRYLQTFIKTLAEEHGYRAAIEVPIDQGFIDVVAENAHETIAFEISVTTDATWELHNIGKCLDKGCNRVVLCSKQASKRQQIQSMLASVLSADQLSMVHILSPDDIPALFTHAKTATSPETLMKGYRVKVKYDKGDGSDNMALLRNIITTGYKSTK